LVHFAGCQDAELADLTLDGESSTLVQQGVSGSDSRRLWLHHLTIRNLVKGRTWGPHAILFSGVNPTMQRGVTDSRISDCRIENIGLGAEFGGGIRMAWGCVRNRIEGNVVRNTGRGGIFGDHSAELVIRENRVSGSGGEGLGIEIWGGCPRSLIEDNVVDHWISDDNSNQSAIRRNTIGADDGSLKYLGIEVIARDVVVTGNVVKRGAHIGLSVSNRPVKNNVYWAYNTVSGCVQWGAQLQGDSGGIARHYFYRCVFENTVRGDPRARYPDSGHGFRTNGSCRDLVLDQCVIRNNGGLGLQLGGKGVDGIFLVGSTIAGNGAAAMTQPAQYTAMELVDCRVEGNRSDRLPPQKAFPKPPPKADFRVPDVIRAGEPAGFQCVSAAAAGTIAERLWDFDHGIPEVTPAPKHRFERPGKYRVTLVVWDDAGRGARAERTVEVLPAR
jgi:parallel beta-helix repeat protein